MKTCICFVLVALALAPSDQAPGRPVSACYLAGGCANATNTTMCYKCCSKKCNSSPSTLNKCLDSCDSVQLINPPMERGDVAGQTDWVLSAAFDPGVFADDQIADLEWVYLNAAPRPAIVVAGNLWNHARYLSHQTRARLRGLIVDGVTDDRAPENRKTALNALHETRLHLSAAGMLAIAERIVGDEDAGVRRHAATVMVFKPRHAE